MNWGLITVILVVVSLVGHMALDGYRMFHNVRRLHHVKYETLDIWRCERCSAVEKGLDDMRHEVGWTAAAVIVLAIHITLDFVA